VSAVVGVRQQEEHLLQGVLRSADQISRGIASATWQMMLVDRRDAACQIMQTVGRDPGIRLVRIFNKEGRVTFSTDPGEPRQVDKSAEACYLCHARSEPLVRVDVPTRARIFRSAAGARRLGIVTPVYNEPACANGGCHAHPAAQRVLGVLDVIMDLSEVDDQVSSVQNRALVTTVVEIVLVALVIAVLVRLLVARPLRKLVAGMERIGAADLQQPLDVKAGGEVGELAAHFSDMRTRLSAALADLQALTHQLETKVEERGAQLAAARLKLVQSDRLASLGSSRRASRTRSTIRWPECSTSPCSCSGSCDPTASRRSVWRNSADTSRKSSSR